MPETPLAAPAGVTVVFQPSGRRCLVRRGSSLLTAAQHAGVGIESGCGGVGTCGECIVRVVAGPVSEPVDEEDSWVLNDDRADGLRLACLTRVPQVDSTVVVDVPESSRIDGHPSQTSAAAITFAEGGSPDGTEVRGDLGVAIDIGTTGLAAYLVDRAHGHVLAARGAPNPQIAFGEDVMSRLNVALRDPSKSVLMRKVLVDELNHLIAALCNETGADRDRLRALEIVGNTAMHHLFFRLPVDTLAWAPYVPADPAAREEPASVLGLELGPGALVHSPPVIAGFVGPDHVAMLLASRADPAVGPVLLLDVGTNTEISLLVGSRHWCCSAASGPAFEGAHIESGMRAAAGAIDRVMISDGRLVARTIDDAPAIGICGSGLLDAVAVLRRENVITDIGAWSRDSPLVQGAGRAAHVVLTFPDPSHEVRLTRRDIGEVQMAKAAIRAGIKLLTEEAGIQESDIRRIVLAGAFGTNLQVDSAMAIGLIPTIPGALVDQVGNAAGAGACLILADRSRVPDRLAHDVTYLELTGSAAFADRFTQALSLSVDPWDDSRPAEIG